MVEQQNVPFSTPGDPGGGRSTQREQRSELVVGVHVTGDLGAIGERALEATFLNKWSVRTPRVLFQFRL